MTKEIMLPYRGVDYEAEKALLLERMQEIENRNLPYFRNRKPIFQDEEHAHLRYHFLFTCAKNIVSIVQVKPYNLPQEIVEEVFLAFKTVFEKKATTYNMCS